MPSANDIVVFDKPSAKRIGQAVRRFEDMQGGQLPGLNKQQFSIEQIIVPRSGPDGDGLYTCDIYIVNDPEADTYTRVATGMKARLLPATIAP